MKTKVCTKCETRYPIKNFYSKGDRLQSHCKQCHCKITSEYHQQNRKKRLQRMRQYDSQRRNQRKQYNEWYSRTLNGHLRHLFSDIKHRCNNPVGKNKCYKGIKNKFLTPEDFILYAVKGLGITKFEQIEGLQIHRIDSKRHYEPGNIQFLTAKEHIMTHVRDKKHV